jgi:ionotropic glutamate receptor NMDA 1
VKKAMELKISNSLIVWPGESRTKPVGFMIPTHLRVLTIEETPFVFVRKVDIEGDCRPDEEPCPHFNTTEDGKLTVTQMIQRKQVFTLIFYELRLKKIL